MRLKPTLAVSRKILRQTLYLITLLFAHEPLSAAPPIPAVIKDQYALVIGVTHYEHWPVLPNAVTDAREIAWLLEKNGFQVTLLTDPNAKQLKEAFEILVDKTGQIPERRIFVYYSGQGETIEGSKGDAVGWIIPRDCPTRREAPDAFVKMATSTQQLSDDALKIKSHQMLMVFDSSFSADAFQEKTPVLRLPGATTNLPIRQYIVAGRQHEPIPDRSTFSSHLIKGLLGEADAIQDDCITGSELGVYLSQELSQAVDNRRHLRYSIHTDKRFSRGDFVLGKLHRPQQTGRLYIDTLPRESSIRVLNIKPKFAQGMDLSPGKYQISVSAEGYRTRTTWITLAVKRNHSVRLHLDAISPQKSNSLAMTFQWIDAGSFYMGKQMTKDYWIDNERPYTVRFTKGFYIQTTEVTTAQFSQFVEATGYRTDAEKAGCWVYSKQGRWLRKNDVTWRQPFHGKLSTAQLDRLPVTCISWNDALSFVNWLSKKEQLNYKLPTEAQWEYACRAGTKTPFAHGTCLTANEANFAGTDGYFKNCVQASFRRPGRPVRVGSLKPNPWHLFDLHGNVSEWCRDWYGNYPAKMMRDPQGPKDGVEKIVRGGHFLSKANECRSARRQSFPPDQAANVIGFRVVMAP